MKIKRILALILCVALCALTLAACGSNGGNKPENKVLKIGVMQFGEFDALQNAHKGFVDGLKDAGYVDGENIKINYLSAAAETSNCPSIADTLINDGSDLILAIATPSVAAIKEKTTTIPVLFTAVTDPVDSKIIADAKNPGGNISGTSDLNPVKEQIDLLKRILPEAKNVAVMYCSSETNSAAQYEMAKAQIEALGMTCVKKTISSIDEAKSAVESLKGQVDAVYIPTDNTIADSMTTVSQAANSINLPVICGEPGMVADGGLATYGIDYYELGKQTAKMAVEILKSDKPLETVGSMPVGYQIDECKYAVNTDTAEKIGVTIPGDLLSESIIYPAK